jgi:hemolysin III
MPKWGVARLTQFIREPFSGLSHLVGAVAAVVGLVDLVSVAAGRNLQLVAFSIYGVSLILLYLSSGIYHSLRVSAEKLTVLRRFDHMAIYLLIAGTYVPLCLIALPGPWGNGLLIAEATMAVVGTIAALAFKGGPSWLRALLYVAMGWLAVVAMGPLSSSLSSYALHWLLAGGIVYTVGAVVYVMDRPRLWPGRFGAHDLWHLFVIGGSACHFVLIRGYLG